MTCQHPACTCQAPSGAEHCSPSCVTAGDDIACACGHPACASSVAETRTVDGDVFDPHTVGESVKAPDTTPEYDGQP